MSEKTGDAIIYGYRTSELEAQQVANKIHNAECEIHLYPHQTKQKRAVCYGR
jgi:hypothetical protein